MSKPGRDILSIFNCFCSHIIFLFFFKIYFAEYLYRWNRFGLEEFIICVVQTFYRNISRNETSYLFVAYFEQAFLLHNSKIISHRCIKSQSLINNIIYVTASLSSRSVALARSMFENGINEFRTDGIIHCWKRPSTTFKPITTSKILLNRNRLRILVVRGKLSS